MEIGLKHKGKIINVNVKKCNLFEMGRGLTFRRREKAPALLFNQWRRGSMALTAFFVFFPFFVLWVDKENNILEIKKVKPFTSMIDSKTNYVKIVEIPINLKYLEIIRILVGRSKDLKRK